MKGLTSRDGKMSGNRQMVERYDSTRHGEGSNSGRGSMNKRAPKPIGGESGGEHEASGHDEIKQVVMEHGPAHTHIIKKSAEGESDHAYSSITHHEDGHKHGPVHHATIEEAHEHGAHAMDDADHLNDMSRDDAEVAGEKHGLEEEGGDAGEHVGFMA